MIWWKQVPRGLRKMKCLFPYFPSLHLSLTLPKTLPQVSAQGGSCLLHERKVEQSRFCTDSKILGGTVLTALNLMTSDHKTQRQERQIRNNAHSGLAFFSPQEGWSIFSPARAVEAMLPPPCSLDFLSSSSEDNTASIQPTYTPLFIAWKA